MYWTLEVRDRAVHELLYKTITQQYFDLLYV